MAAFNGGVGLLKNTTLVSGTQLTITLRVRVGCLLPGLPYSLTDQLPAGRQHLSSTGGTLGGNNAVTFGNLNLATGQTTTCQIQAQPLLGSGCYPTTPLNDDRDANTAGGRQPQWPRPGRYGRGRRPGPGNGEQRCHEHAPGPGGVQPPGRAAAVQLVLFTAQAAVRLAWATASELGSARFEVERSPNGSVFAQIGQVAAAGTSAAAHSCGLLNSALPAGSILLYYRLRQADLDGNAHYSPVRVVALAAAGLALYPNPTQQLTTLTGAAPHATVQVFDALGRAVATATTEADGTAQLLLPSGLASGSYVVRTGTQALRLGAGVGSLTGSSRSLHQPVGAFLELSRLRRCRRFTAPAAAGAAGHACALEHRSWRKVIATG